MKTFQGFILLLKDLHGIYQQRNIQNKTCMLDHQGQISIAATVERGPVYVSIVISYSLAYDADYILDNDNLATALSAQIQISIVLISMVRKPAVEPIVLAKTWSIAPEKAQKIIQATMQRRIATMLHPSLSR